MHFPFNLNHSWFKIFPIICLVCPSHLIQMTCKQQLVFIQMKEFHVGWVQTADTNYYVLDILLRDTESNQGINCIQVSVDGIISFNRSGLWMDPCGTPTKKDRYMFDNRLSKRLKSIILTAPMTSTSLNNDRVIIVFVYSTSCKLKWQVMSWCINCIS